MRQTTVRYAINAVSWGPNWLTHSSGSDAIVIVPQSGHCRPWQRCSVMWAEIVGSSVT